MNVISTDIKFGIFFRKLNLYFKTIMNKRHKKNELNFLALILIYSFIGTLKS